MENRVRRTVILALRNSNRPPREDLEAMTRALARDAAVTTDALIAYHSTQIRRAAEQESE
jgi:hypothetical protein